jgi:hypothetical protein
LQLCDIWGCYVGEGVDVGLRNVGICRQVHAALQPRRPIGHNCFLPHPLQFTVETPGLPW